MTGPLLLAAGCLVGALGMHPFTTYPISLRVLARLRPHPLRVAAGAPDRVALCVCAYNEERVIRAKAENMLALRQQVPGLRLMIYVDAATDGTADILRGYADRIDLVVSEARHGKTYGMNRLVAASDADIVVFSDANVAFAPDAVGHLLDAFRDPAVGCACGHLVYTGADASATAGAGSLYWRLEEAIKDGESRTGSTMGADGSIFAIRRALHRPPPPDIIDDMFVSLSILCDGWRVVRVPDALAYEPSASNAADEARRKIRIACQAFNVHRLLWPRLRALPALDLYKYVSHKLLRWFSGFLLAGGCVLFAAGLVVMGAWVPLGVLCLLAILLPALAWAAPASPPARLVGMASALVATGLGVLRSLRGERFQVWNPPASARDGSPMPGPALPGALRPPGP